MTVINNRNTNVFRGQRRIFVGGAWVTLAAAAALASIPGDDGSTYYDPYGYVPVAQPVCRGVTAEGCRLSWQSVATEDGGQQSQCVQYCRRGGTIPVAASAAGLAASGAVQQAQAATADPQNATPAGCSLVIYSDQAFGGQSAPTDQNQPQLSDVGWDKAISSIQVKAGTWDFYSDDNYGGDTMRLTAGQYAALADWDKLISSFMCSQSP